MEQEQPAIFQAVLASSTSYVQEIIRQNPVCVNAQTAAGVTPLALATSKEIVQALLNAGAKVRTVDVLNQTPLHKLCAMPNTDTLEIVQLLINTVPPQERPEFLNAKDLEDWTALHWAVFSRQPELAQILLASGIHVDAKNGTGKTALHMAIDGDALESIRVLLLAGAHVQKSYISIAKSHKKPAITRLLREIYNLQY
jgi:ankyrin repeat protein